MIGAYSKASFGSCVQAHHGAICRSAMAHVPPATTVSSGGKRPEYGTGSWSHLPPLMMRPSKRSTRPSCACISTPPVLLGTEANRWVAHEAKASKRRPRAPDYWEPYEATEIAELAIASDNAEGADIAA